MAEPAKLERKKISLHPMLSEEDARAVAKETLKDLVLEYQPGQVTPDGTIYLGVYKPKDRDGKSLSKTFNVFAAPEDLPEKMTYVDTVKHIAGLKGWYGFDGTNYATDKEIYAALKDGSYNGGWIIPPYELLVGTEPGKNSLVYRSKVVQPDNLFYHKNTGAFKGTFKTDDAGYSFSYNVWYWSSTERRNKQSDAWIVGFSVGDNDSCFKNTHCLNCRPVRLVEVPGL